METPQSSSPITSPSTRTVQYALQESGTYSTYLLQLLHAAVLSYTSGLTMPASGLVAILLITRTRPGPRLVFHCPQEPDYAPQRRGCTVGSDTDTDTDTDSDEDEHEDGEQPSGVFVPVVVPDEARQNLDGGAARKGQTLFGRSVESLEKVLSPGRWSDGKKFEINLDGLVFVGHPVYAHENGDWSSEIARSASKDGTDMVGLDLDSIATTTSPKLSGKRRETLADSFGSTADPGFGTSMQTASSTGSDPNADGSMAMFHVVFVLRGSSPQSQAQVRAAYHEVVERLNRALHYCQKVSNYVTEQKLSVLGMKARQADAKSWLELVKSSELARALNETFDRIVQGEAAVVQLDGIELSLCMRDTKNQETRATRLDPLSAILLLDSKEDLLRELSHPDASPLATFIREYTPTKNLQKNAAYIGMPIDDILYLASHLITWRKAKVISPLHQRNTYVVARTAPINDIQKHISEYHRQFPTLPTLLNMLKVLSGKPIRYGLLIPSRDHRNAYMEILSYLVRHHFVVQLRTFGWLRLPIALLDQPTLRSSETSERPQPARDNLLMPRTGPAEYEVVGSRSERMTAAQLSKLTRRTSLGSQASEIGNNSEKDDVHVLITNPHEPDEQQKMLIHALRSSLRDPDMQELFPRLVLHLDGQNPLEAIAAREGWRRACVEDALAEIDKYLVTFRHVV